VQKKKQHKSGLRVTGVIIPAKWDGLGSVIGVSIQTHDEKIYLVEPNFKGPDLLKFTREMVSADGDIREDLDGKTLISVREYEIVSRQAAEKQPRG